MLVGVEGFKLQVIADHQPALALEERNEHLGCMCAGSFLKDHPVELRKIVALQDAGSQACGEDEIGGLVEKSLDVAVLPCEQLPPRLERRAGKLCLPGINLRQAPNVLLASGESLGTKRAERRIGLEFEDVSTLGLM